MSPSPDNGDPGEPPKLRVLVVDDEPTLRLGFAYALSNRTTAVETAPTGRHALDRIASMKFDIIILDLRMPELDGLGVIDILREKGNLIPVVLCTAFLSPVAALRAIRHGVVDFLMKPVRPVDLRQVIEFVLQPGKSPFSLAMQALRAGKTQEAIDLLETDPAPGKQVSHWLDILKTMRDSDPAGDNDPLEEKVRISLSTLAFNPSAAS